LLSLFVLLVGDASAQRRGGFAAGFGRGGFPSGRARVMFPYGFGYGYSVSDGGPAYAYSPQPFVVVETPPPVVEPPPREVRPIVTNYTWPDRAASAPSKGDTRVFGIVLRDGSTLSATMVVASDDALHFVDPDERHLRVSMRDVDRAATVRLNRERELNLPLPASPQ
jgi:hypothetical protein